jgi:dihydrofolate reductase
VSQLDIVVAADQEWGIGKNDQVPWRLSSDVRWFKELTSAQEPAGIQSTVIMGRKTWDSIPDRFRPLPNRLNVVVSRNPELTLPFGVLSATSVAQALEKSGAGRVFCIGGGEIYRLAMEMPQCTRIYLTRVSGDFECDTFLPQPGPEWTLTSLRDPVQENGIGYDIVLLSR